MFELKLFIFRHPQVDKVNTAICYSFPVVVGLPIESACSTWVYAEAPEFWEQQTGPGCAVRFVYAGDSES